MSILQEDTGSYCTVAKLHLNEFIMRLSRMLLIELSETTDADLRAHTHTYACNWQRVVHSKRIEIY